jgi:autoinducer 2 (AI-2) kinase
MPEQYLLAVDAGTGSVRAVLFDAAGKQTGCVQREWEHREDPRYPGSMDFDWNHNWRLARGCIRDVLKETGVRPGDVAAVSTTCMREGIVLYDAAGKEIWACANVDARATDEVGELIRMNPDMERDIYLESGETYALGALPRLLWVKNKQPEIYAKIARVGMFNDWLIYRMSGVLEVDPSNASTTGLLNLQKRDWAPAIPERCGLRGDIFPPVRECGSVVAGVSAAGAAETGLAEGTPLVVGGGDAQLGSIGVGVVRPDQAAVFGGSFWQYEFNTANGRTDLGCRVRVNCHAVPGVWQYEALAFKPGLAMRWFRDGFCQQEKVEGEASGRDPYAIMDQEAAKIPPGCYDMLCAFSDVMNFIAWKHAAPTFSNFDFDARKYNKYTFYRAIMENTAMVTLGHVKLVREATGNMPGEIVFAGGAAKSPLWCQIVADVLGLPVRVPEVKEASALGAAILAGYGAGMYADISAAARELVRWDREYVPNADAHRLYEDMYEPWRRVYASELALADAGLTRHMWIAPGL